MPIDLRHPSLQNLDDVLRVVNVSAAHDSPMKLNVDFLGFLGISKLWQLSFAHSYVAYVDSEPAGVMLNTVDPEEREAYSFYGGVLPEFRRRGVFLELFRAFLEQIRDEHYLKAYADTMSPAVIGICRSLGYRVKHELADMQAGAPPQYAGESIAVRPIAAGELLTETPFRSWKTRRRFLTSASSFLRGYAAECDGARQAFLVVGNWGGETSILEIGWTDGYERAATRLIASLPEHGHLAPFVAYDVLPGSAPHTLFQRSGFTEMRRPLSLMLELSDYVPALSRS